ncbi:MAG: cupin domain-containing protein [Gammaproteobacteria bacterium]|nr:cupin domain-containing protein [Gammaproteobacteria bacterium]
MANAQAEYMIEINSIDLPRPINQIGKIIGFTAADDEHWAGVVDVPAYGALSLAPNMRTDLYLLEGELAEGDDLVYPVGSFINRRVGTTLIAGAAGARVFRYNDRTHADSAVMLPRQLRWREGGAPGMQVATLFSVPHRLMLVSWRPGTRTRFHQHPFGEEIFVIAGELQDERGRYPAGTWQRLHREAGHAPFAETDTIILLRNGHLRS